jgi:hypothetical protein
MTKSFCDIIRCYDPLCEDFMMIFNCEGQIAIGLTTFIKENEVLLLNKEKAEELIKILQDRIEMLEKENQK